MRTAGGAFRHINGSLARGLLLLFMALSALIATSDDILSPDQIASRYTRNKTYTGYSLMTDPIDNEESFMLYITEVTVFPPLKFKNKKEEEFYWKTVRDVKKALPYAKLICETMLETYEYIETLPTAKERQDHLKRMEHSVFEQYKPVLKRFTKNQARMLVKLVNRETNQSGYNILKAFLGGFRAGFWQTFGRLFGVNLRASYRPDRDRKDAIIERVAVMVEAGQL